MKEIKREQPNSQVQSCSVTPQREKGLHLNNIMLVNEIVSALIDTDVTRRIILNADIPVYQPARRLSYAEKKSVSKHIEELLEQGIVRPISSESASSIVLVKNKKTYNKKRKKAPEYQVGDLVAVQRTQFGGSLKLRREFFRPYHITEVKPRDIYS
ncbi:hypothetical protein TNCV_4635891 [Trichonephila clavipes]|nr:hypothetical protein TNCV_4635891 [Trichonephila clavipes]